MFGELAGWNCDDHRAAFSCFQNSARAHRSELVQSRPGKALTAELARLLALSLQSKYDRVSQKSAKSFFEDHFCVHKPQNSNGFVTAYYEPEVSASRERTATFTYPIYKKPDELVRIEPDSLRGNDGHSLEWARKSGAGFAPFHDRKAIDEGALDGKGLELFFVSSAIEAFYIHIQGSARLKLTDGTATRITYAGKSGHPYTSIGKLLINRGVMNVSEANMVNIRAWLHADSDRGTRLMHENRSYIFFSEVRDQDMDAGPKAGAGVALTPGRSIAVDKSEHAYGTPIWVNTEKPLPGEAGPFARLMVAQDTGSAIVGPARGDLFLGSGDKIGQIAGAVRHAAEFVVLVPKG